MKTADKKSALVNDLVSKYGNTISRQQMFDSATKFGVNPGFLTATKVGRGMYDISAFAAGAVASAVAAKVPELTDEEILDSQHRRFRTLSRMAEGVTQGNVTSMIAAGPAGIGKTYMIEGLLQSAADRGEIQYTAVRGFVRATGLYKLLWEHKEANQVLLLDDADSAFSDEISLNLLKAALDSSKRREISWRSEKEFSDGGGEGIPNTFEFKGSVIFITNLNFEMMIAQGNKLAPHLSALISRSYYIDLNLGSAREYLVRIKDVLNNTDMAYTLGLTDVQTKKLNLFIDKNYMKFRELSLRMIVKLAKIMLFTTDDGDFYDVVSTTCFKSR